MSSPNHRWVCGFTIRASGRYGLGDVSVLTVVWNASALLAGLGSSVVAVTAAASIATPGSVGVTVIVIVAWPAAGTMPRPHETTPAAWVQPPWLAAVVPKVPPAGSVSVSVTPAAGRGPPLLTVRP